MTCAHRNCGHYASGAAWYCTAECATAEAEAHARRKVAATPPTAVPYESGLRARLGMVGQ